MIKPSASWDLYRTFLDVVKDGSLSGAARRLGLTQPTTGRHIDTLEQSLGVPLFTRSQRGLLPTPAALALVPHVEAMAAAEAAMKRTVSGVAGVETGCVRVTASEVVACEILPLVLAPFCEAHPSIEVEISVGNRVQDLLRRDSDIAVRTQRPTQAALTAKRVGVAHIGLFAHRAYIEAHGLPERVEDLARHRLIGFDSDDTAFRAVGSRATATPGRAITRTTFNFRTDSDPVQLAAMRAGVGICGCQTRIAARDMDLVPVLPDAVRYRLEFWLAMHEDQRKSRPVRLMFDHLAKGLADYWAKSGC
jgi:DNA-binding transcriptional LysR family regulator